MITKPFILDETGQKMLDVMTQQNAFLQVIAGENYTTMVSDIKQVLGIVRAGLAPKVFNIGDQLIWKWKDVADSNKEYTVPVDIVHFGTSMLEDGEELPSMTIQWHYATPFGVQFSNYQAFYYAAEALPAGTYNVEIGTTWGDKGYCVAGKKYQFTLAKPVPKGGQLAGFYGAPDQAPSTWKVYSYESNTAKDPIETVPVTEGATGTKLGTLKTGGDGTLNCLQRTAYGYNRWAQSALRQWLNSDAAVGLWWTPQNNFDRCPDQLATKAGFLTGFDEDISAALRAVKVSTALNTVTDFVTGSGLESPLEVTYDKIFIPSLEQMYIAPQLAGEGASWEYWRRASGRTAKMELYKTYPKIRTFAAENHTSPQSVRVRSAYRGDSYGTWYVYSDGGVGNYYYAIYAYRCAPACELC